METIKKVLRPRKPKISKPLPLTNAERCRRYKDKIKQDPTAYEIFKVKRKAECEKYLAGLSEEQKLLKREKDRLRQRKYREKLKSSKQQTPAITPMKTPLKSSTPKSKVKTRVQHQKEVERRQKNKESQRRRRACMSSQKKRREREKRMNYYYRKKMEAVGEPKVKKTCKMRLSSLLNGVVRTVQKSRSKLALFKLEFARKLLKRESPHPSQTFDCRYKRSARSSFVVEHFFEKVAIPYPGQRNASVDSKVLTKPLIDLYKQFRTEHQDCKISLTTFKRRRPRNICLSSSRKFLQCLCERCTNVMLLMNVLNPHLKSKTDSGMLNEKVSNVDDLVSKTVCEIVTRDCYERNCSLCGVYPFLDAVKNQIKDLQVVTEYKRWGKNERGVKDLLIRHESLFKIVDLLEQDLLTIAKHLKVAQWQRKQYQFISKNLPPRHAVCTIDFAENYLCRFQDEIQSAHWSYRQVSIHPCVFFRSCTHCSKSVTEYLVFISDDLKHDSHFSKTVLEKCISHAKEKEIISLHFFSDGCGAQYKSKTTFMDLTDLQMHHKDLTLTRHFFGSNHGKSLCDSCGGVVKNSATRAVASGNTLIQSAEDMFNFCQKNLSATNDDCPHLQSLRQFVLLKQDEIERHSVDNLKPLTGTRQIHSLKPSKTQRGLLSVSELSCFCHSCLLGEEGTCPNLNFTNGWSAATLQALKPRNEKRLKIRKQKPSNNVTTSLGSSDNIPVDLNEAFISDKSFTVTESSESSCRCSFFMSLQHKFSLCESFNELVAVAREATPTLNSFPLPYVKARTVMEVGIVDKIAYTLLPDGIKDYVYPVVTEPDGNCVPRALSLLVFGNQDSHVEIRCRIVHELSLNHFDYLYLDSNVLNLVCMLSDHASDNITETFQNEVLSVSRNATFMGYWQLMAAANVLRAPILSVYPKLGPNSYVSLFNQTLHPKQPLTDHTLLLMWSSTRDRHKMTDEHWVANHVTPLMPLHELMEVVSVVGETN